MSDLERNMRQIQRKVDAAKLERKKAIDNCRQGNYFPTSGNGLQFLLNYLRDNPNYAPDDGRRFFPASLVTLRDEGGVTREEIGTWITAASEKAKDNPTE